MPEDLVINSLRGGLVDSDPPNALPDDACTIACNVEWFSATIGERRNGCTPFSIAGSGMEAEDGIVHLSQWYPENQVNDPDYWAIGASPDTTVTLAKYSSGAWATVVPADPISPLAPDVYDITTQAVNGKLFFAYRSAVDRLHVYDTEAGTLRPTGLSQPEAPTVADEGSGTYAGLRYFRIRYVQINVDGDILRRSEPSESLAFTPSGTGAGATITRPALIGEGETHWEVEASDDDADFYKIATVLAATTTYDDETVLVTGYADGVLSEDIGDYLLLPSAKYLAVDGDRLLMGGHWTDVTRQSRIAWTPVLNDPGAGNDERLPLSIDNTVDLDNYEGGPLTGISASTNGTWYAFKWSHIYKMSRTGDVVRAYDVLTISKSRGAIPGSIISGVTESGASCIYFLDPMLGPSRLGPGGLQVITGLRQTWARVNLRAAMIVARGCYYPYKQQIHWWVAVDGSESPSLKLVLQVSELQASVGGGVGRGWSTATGRIAEATAVSVFTEWINIGGILSLSMRPFIGLTSPDGIQRCDTGTTDAGVGYIATIRTRPFFVQGLLNRWGAMTAALLAGAHATAHILVKFIRNFGLETNQITTDLAPELDEAYVIKVFDNLVMSSAIGIQVEFTDPPAE